MARADRCPECRSPIHPFAATCSACGADLDAHRRRLRVRRTRRLTVRAPSVSLDRELRDLVFITLVMLLVALYAPLFGVVLALLVGWHGYRNGVTNQVIAALVCGAIAFVDFALPAAISPPSL